MQIVDRQFDAYQSFVLGCKLFWTTRMFPELYAVCRQRAEEFARRTGHAPTGPEEVSTLLDADPLCRHLRGAGQLDSVSLPVVEGHSCDVVEAKPVQRPVQAGGGILATGEHDEGGLHGGFSRISRKRPA